MSTLHVQITDTTSDRSDAIRRALSTAGLRPDQITITEGPHLTRDPAGATLGAILLAVFGALAVWLFLLGGWWIALAIPAALLALMGLFGLVTDVQKKDRTKTSAKEQT